MSKLLAYFRNNAVLSKLLAYARRDSRLLDYILANANEIERFLKFFLVGTLGTIIDFGTLNLLILAFGFGKALANTCSFTAAVLSNFTWNRLWTFP